MNNSTNKAIIRKATRNDASDILSLVRELAIYEKAEDQVTASLSEYENFLSDGKIFANLAIIDNEIVGMVLYYETFSTWRGLMYYLEDFIVKEAYRKQGIGEKLMNSFMNEAKMAGAKLVKWQVLDWNEPAINFYKKMGCIIEDEWWNVKKFINPS